MNGNFNILIPPQVYVIDGDREDKASEITLNFKAIASHYYGKNFMTSSYSDSIV